VAQDEGQAACAAVSIEVIPHGEAALIPFEELVEATRVSFDVVEVLG